MWGRVRILGIPNINHGPFLKPWLQNKNTQLKLKEQPCEIQLSSHASFERFQQFGRVWLPHFVHSVIWVTHLPLLLPKLTVLSAAWLVSCACVQLLKILGVLLFNWMNGWDALLRAKQMYESLPEAWYKVCGSRQSTWLYLDQAVKMSNIDFQFQKEAELTPLENLLFVKFVHIVFLTIPSKQSHMLQMFWDTPGCTLASKLGLAFKRQLQYHHYYLYVPVGLNTYYLYAFLNTWLCFINQQILKIFIWEIEASLVRLRGRQKAKGFPQCCVYSSFLYILSFTFYTAIHFAFQCNSCSLV